MKKPLAIFISVVVLAAGAIFFYIATHQAKIASLDAIVPDDAIYYLYSSNIASKIGEFKATGFFQQLFNTSAYKKFINQKLEKLNKKVPFLPELLQKDVAFAVFSLGDIEATKRDISDFGDFMLLLRVDPKSNFNLKKIIADFYLSFAAKKEVNHEKYKGVDITKYTVAEYKMEVLYCILSDVILLANNSSVIKRSIDLFRNESKSSLGTNIYFQRLRARVSPDALGYVYNNTRYYYQEMLRAYTSSSLRQRDQKSAESVEALIRMQPFINLMNVFEGSISYLVYDVAKSGFVINGYHSFNRAADEDNILNIVAYNKDLDKGTFELIPRDIIAYCGGSRDFLGFWKFIKKISLSMGEIIKARIASDPRYGAYPVAPSFEDIIAQIESFLGISIENDFISLLGSNFGGVFVSLENADIPISNQEPPASMALGQKQEINIALPQLFGFLELKNSQQMQELMQQISQNLVTKINESFRRSFEQLNAMNAPQAQALPQKEEMDFLKIKADNYNGVDIFSIETPLLPPGIFKPSYSIIGKYIIFSFTPELNKKVIDAYKNKGSSLTTNISFESIQSNLSSDFSNMLFFDVAKLIKSIEATKYFATFKDSIQKANRQEFSKEDLDSILEILRNISAVSITGRVLNDDTIESSVHIKMTGL